MSGTLQSIADAGNRYNDPDAQWPHCHVVIHNNRIQCADGFSVSVIAGPGCYSNPRPPLMPGLPMDPVFGNVPFDYRGPYTHFEVGFPTERPEPWEEWKGYAEVTDAPTETVYYYVPLATIAALIEAHGGER